jgi:DNA-binding CsgD family transcriptional regulator
MSEERPTRRALVLEVDPLVSERVRSMLRSEDFNTCLVDDWLLFRTLAAHTRFHFFVVDASAAQRNSALEVLRKLDPLAILVGADDATLAHFRMALPTATAVERSLRDPDALRRALGGVSVSAPVVPAVAASTPQDWVRAAFESFALSDRQLEVLAWALRGDTSREIAARLYISEPTVRNHLHAIYERLGVSGRRELLGRFVRGLIDQSAEAERGPGADPVTGSSGTRSAPDADEN